jgi:hypothetical protein
MSNTIIKSFAVMITGIFALGFLVTTATTPATFAEAAKQATITFEDKSTTKNISLCVNNTPAVSGVKVNIGSINVKAFYNLSPVACDSAKNKVFEITKDLTAGQTLQIVAEGTAAVTGVKETTKPVLLKTTDLPGILSQNTVSFKAIANSNVKYKDAICMDGFLIKEDAPGSMKNKVIHSDEPRNFSFDFTRNGAFCTMSDSSPKLAIDIRCGCEGAKLYEIGFETNKDNSNISYNGLTFTTKIVEAPVVPVTPVTPTVPTTPTTPTVPTTPSVPVKPVTPVAPTIPSVVTPVASTTPTATTAPLIAAQTATVRSGGSNVLLILPVLATFGLLSYIATKNKKFQIG